MIKKTLVIVLLFLLVFSVFGYAQAEDTSDDCNFFCKVGRFFWGNAENEINLNNISVVRN